MTLVGKKAPDFELEGTQKGESKKFRLESIKGWRVLLFYPRSFTGVCASEVTGFAGEEERFSKLDAHIIAISTDSPFVHKAWLESEAKGGGHPRPAGATN